MTSLVTIFMSYMLEDLQFISISRLPCLALLIQLTVDEKLKRKAEI